VRELNKSLQGHGFASGEIHGDMDQANRLKELARFKAGEINILVASDVAARGLDIKGASHVFNFDTPWHPDDYVHRIGRTGRAGAKGRAFTFVAEDDAEAIENVEKLTGAAVPVFGKKDVRVELVEAPKDDAREVERKDDTRNDERKPRRESKRDREEEPREERPRAPRRETPAKSERAERPRQGRGRRDADEEPVPAGEWNGPKPDFLGVGFN
jgi:superfamily II DNA/RNA helicase